MIPFNPFSYAVVYMSATVSIGISSRRFTVDDIEESIYFWIVPCILTLKNGSILCAVVTYSGKSLSVPNSSLIIGW